LSANFNTYTLLYEFVLIFLLKSYNQKLKDVPKLYARDRFYGCFFCGDRFVEGDQYFGRTEHHLNGNPKIDELWNKVLCHNICNIKAENYIEWKVISHDKLLWNLKHDPTLEEIKMAEESLLRDGIGIMIELNVIHSKICLEVVLEKLKVEPFWKFIDAISECTFKSKEKTGHGSVQSIRNYLNVLCAESGLFEKVKLDGITVIRKKSGM